MPINPTTLEMNLMKDQKLVADTSVVMGRMQGRMDGQTPVILYINKPFGLFSIYKAAFWRIFHN